MRDRLWLEAEVRTVFIGLGAAMGGVTKRRMVARNFFCTLYQSVNPRQSMFKTS